MSKLTINADLGEGIPSESLLLDYIDRASIACGGHFGTYDTLSTTIQNAKDKNVPCGAHPSFPDKENFGRKPLNISHEKLLDSLTSQLELFLEVAGKLNIEIDHIKAHGALYNLMMEDMEIAELLLVARERLNLICPIFALCNSRFFEEFNKEVPLIKEAFIDRKYTSNNELASRHLVGAVIQDVDVANSQYMAFTNHQPFSAMNGEDLILIPDTVCIHGDNPAAISILEYIRNV